MRLLIQKVKKASVTIDNSLYSSIDRGLLILIGIEHEDTDEDVKWLAEKVSKMRLFDDEKGVMNYSILDVDGEILVVSQFTLHASTKKGNRPSYIKSARPEISKPLYELFLRELSVILKKDVPHGEFGTHMNVELINDGPITIIIDSKKRE